MGTSCHFDRMLEATDPEVHRKPGGRRQLELLIPSGTNQINLRLGRLNSENGGDGLAVHLDRAAAQELADALVEAIERLGDFIR